MRTRRHMSIIHTGPRTSFQRRAIIMIAPTRAKPAQVADASLTMEGTNIASADGSVQEGVRPTTIPSNICCDIVAQAQESNNQPKNIPGTCAHSPTTHRQQLPQDEHLVVSPLTEQLDTRRQLHRRALVLLTKILYSYSGVTDSTVLSPSVEAFLLVFPLPSLLFLLFFHRQFSSKGIGPRSTPLAPTPL